MQGRSRVRLFAHWAHYCQIPLPVVTDHVLIRWVHHFKVRTYLLPLLYASATEYVLALSTLFSLYDNHLANAADEVLIKLCIGCLYIIHILPFF